jgi:hypothetical protein
MMSVRQETLFKGLGSQTLAESSFSPAVVVFCNINIIDFFIENEKKTFLPLQ